MSKRPLPKYEDITFDTVSLELSFADVSHLLAMYEKAGFDIKKRDMQPSEAAAYPPMLTRLRAANELFEAGMEFGRCLNNVTVLNNRSD